MTESLEILKQIQYEINKFLNMSTTRASKEAGETASKKVAGTAEEQVRGAKPNKALQKDKAVESDIISNGGKNLPKRNSKFRDDLDDKWFKENGELDWPQNDGFVGKPNRQTLKEGETIDRFSSETGTDDFGNFLSPVDTPYGNRTLPYDASKMKYAKYEVVKKIEVTSGKSAPWFGEKGGGIQHQTDMSVGELVENGFLREIK